MPTKHTRSGVDFEYSAVFVGVRSNTGLVMRVWVSPDGRLSDGHRVYELPQGVSATGAAMTVFGLTKIRRFAVSDLLAAAYYAAQLRGDQGLGQGVSGRAAM